MDAFPWTTLIILVVVATLGAGVMHAVVASFEQVPYARERELESSRRPDGRRTSVAKLAALPDHADSASSVVYSVLEALALVSWAFIAWQIADGLDWSWGWVLAAAAGVGAVLSLLVIRAVPRGLAKAYPESTLRALAPVAWFFVWITTPIRAVVPALSYPELTEAEDLVEQAEGALEADEAELLRSIVGLGETLVREVMVPRTDMITIQAGTPVRKAMLLFLRSGFSRVPVIGDGTDDVRGVIYLKDCVRDTWDSSERLEEPVDALMRDPEFVPESLAVDELLRRMQDEVFHLGVVVDEFGGVAGLVTIEDALEEIVGEVVDEHDRVAPEAEALPGGAYRVPARMPLDELAELFDVEIDDEDVETVAGLLTKALGKVPIPGAHAKAHGLELLADRAEGRRRRLTSVVVRRDDEPEPTDTGERRTVRAGRSRRKEHDDD
ncbi:hemolysin family protein [Demequina capsici]|uniref:Hemolysin family protein n=1 Tax=Demequina capsici TaxID=3075620 RepID=A0AA96J8W8_9MICO|nr:MULTISPECIES: hemolysin family protein [unclassified Demequina]WNM25483.1 hemolysin family protein [Demequina sp. OYTSA14]WNM28364.1 hemolysin family protein [Demequina sp. PMTSA13]